MQQMMVGADGSYRGQEMLSYASQRNMIDAKMEEQTHAWMHHTGGETCLLSRLAECASGSSVPEFVQSNAFRSLF